jgi:hypothetical protein
VVCSRRRVDGKPGSNHLKMLKSCGWLKHCASAKRTTWWVIRDEDRGMAQSQPTPATQLAVSLRIAVSTASIRRLEGKGLCRYATHPASKADLRLASLSTAVIKMTGTEWPECVN